MQGEIALTTSVRRRASGIVRTLVVASSTLAILLVCFTIYQATQVDPDGQVSSTAPSSPAAQELADIDAGPEDTRGIAFGREKLRIGYGRDITLTLYAREGTRERGEIHVRELEPVEGKTNEFLVISPDIRLRTKSGNNVRVTAERGFIEASRRTSGALDPQRGQLSGQVVIEIDRRTDEDRAKLPEALRDKPDPASIIRAEMGELHFDVEYAKVVIPGRLHISASDVELIAADLIVRFNEAENRVEYLRIDRPEQLTLIQRSDDQSTALPGMTAPVERTITLADMLRATLEKRLALQQADREAEARRRAEEEAVEAAEDEPPPFMPEAPEKKKPRPPVKYFARFEGDIDATRYQGDTIVARLQADVLEILRDFKPEDRQRLREQASPGDPGGDAAAPVALERLVLNWTGRLVVEAIDLEDERALGAERAKITASGSPVRLSHQGGATDATCSFLAFDPDRGEALLFGDDENAVVVRSADHGVLKGMQITSRRDGERMHTLIQGPGVLLHGLDGGGAEEGDRGTTIEFSDRLELLGRFETQTRIDFTGTLSRKEQRILERAVFTGGVEMRQGDTRISADSLTAHMGAGQRQRGDTPAIERLEGRGHVVMMRAEDRLTCREIDVKLTTDRDGRVTPLTATATGDVTAIQGSRTTYARDELIVDFETTLRAPPPFDAVKAYAAAVEAGEDMTAIDWEARRRAYESKERTVLGIRRLRACGAVTIEDSTQELDLSCRRLDCTVVDGEQISKATVIGPEDRPALVRLGAMSVRGKKIELDVPNQWAEVPGEGGMTFQSRKDLNGRKLKEPIPIKVEWRDWMRYLGRENRAFFEGQVKAISKEDTTFECDRLVVEFDDVPNGERAESRADWWIFQGMADRLKSKEESRSALTTGDFLKEPAHIVATGHAKAETSEFDAATRALKSRALLSGPKLSVNLRKGASKMIIEGTGDLLLEDLRPPSSAADKGRASASLLAIDQGDGPSVTLISWHNLMLYDFSLDQTRFEGDVELKHFSGERYDALRGERAGTPDEELTGRQTFLECDVLTIDFLQKTRKTSLDNNRMGRISADRLKQFQASKSVTLQDMSLGLWLSADRLTYERDRDLLEIRGTLSQPAKINIQDASGSYTATEAALLFYNIRTQKIEGTSARLRGR
jgi:hypothetical protein